MSKELEILERLDLYLEGKLSSGDKAALEAQMEADPSLAELVRHQKISNELILGERLHNVKAMMDRDFAAGKVRGSSGGLKWWISGLAVTGALVFFMVYQSPKTSLISPDKENLPAERKMDKNEHAPNTPEPPKSHRPVKEKQGIDKTENKGTPPVEKDEPAHLSNDEKDNEVVKTDDVSEKVTIIEEEQGVLKTEIPEKRPAAEVPVPEPEKEKAAIPKEETKRIRKGEDYGFKPEFGEVFQLTLPEGKQADMKIMNRAGSLVFNQKMEPGQTLIWDGRSLQGGISPEGLYIYVLEFDNGEKESGQIIIY